MAVNKICLLYSCPLIRCLLFRYPFYIFFFRPTRVNIPSSSCETSARQTSKVFSNSCTMEKFRYTFIKVLQTSKVFSNSCTMEKFRYIFNQLLGDWEDLKSLLKFMYHGAEQNFEKWGWSLFRNPKWDFLNGTICSTFM